MSKYLIASLVAAMLSVMCAALVLGGLYGWNPLRLTIVLDAANAQSAADRAAAISAIATISAAISTVFALLVGTIAVIAVIVAERSETKSIEQLKLDLAAAVSILVSLRDRSVLYTNPEAVDVSLDPFKMEREALAGILCSSTGFALYVWSMDRRNESFKDIYHGLAGLIDSTTLDLRGNFQPVANHIFERSSLILADIVRLDEGHFKRMSRKLTRIGIGMRQAGEAVARDPISDFAESMRVDAVASIPPPTEEELAAIKKVAQERIGGKASETIEHFGRAAIEGGPEDRATFRKLVRQLKLTMERTEDVPTGAQQDAETRRE